LVETRRRHHRLAELHAMKLLIQSAMIFFGTLMAAGLVALGEPAGAHLALTAGPASAIPLAASTQPQR